MMRSHLTLRLFHFRMAFLLSIRPIAMGRESVRDPLPELILETAYVSMLMTGQLGLMSFLRVNPGHFVVLQTVRRLPRLRAALRRIHFLHLPRTRCFISNQHADLFKPLVSAVVLFRQR